MSERLLAIVLTAGGILILIKSFMMLSNGIYKDRYNNSFMLDEVWPLAIIFPLAGLIMVSGGIYYLWTNRSNPWD